jgi:hypothetical protein
MNTTTPTEKKKPGRPAGTVRPAATSPGPSIPKLAEDKERVIRELGTILAAPGTVGFDIAFEIGYRETRAIVDAYQRERREFDAEFRVQTIEKLTAIGVDVSALADPEGAGQATRPHTATSSAATGA